MPRNAIKNNPNPLVKKDKYGTYSNMRLNSLKYRTRNLDKNSKKMDKNKYTYKVKGIGPIYYLNLDGQSERREYMEDQFKYWEIENYTRISAYDGREDDLGDIIKGKYPEVMTSGEIGCVTSHLKAIKHWMETSDSPYAVIMEDDCNLDLVKFWNFTWDDFYCRIVS